MRIEKTMNKLNTINTEAFIVSNMKNIRYLSGFTGDTGKLLLVKDKAFIIVDGRFTEQAEKECNIEVVDYNGSFNKTIKGILDKFNVTRCAFEGDSTTVNEFDFMKKAIDNVELISTKNIIEEIRVIKDEGEIDLIKKALDISLKVFDSIKEEVVPGVTEKEVANEIEYRMKKLGADGVAFETVVASGTRSSLPHGTPTDKEIEFGDAVVIDMGATYNGYAADMTRTIFVGDMTREQEKVYEIVERAQKKAINMIEAGVKCSDANQVVVDEFNKENLAEFFVHSLGHGVGLDVHERPYLAKSSTDVFKPGMVVTIEPGIYLPNKFGVRIEDMAMID